MDKQAHLYELTRDLADKWTETAEKHIKDKIQSTLDKRLEELILVLCGFEKEVSRTMYGWKVDHCNNRSGNSPIGQIINEALKDRIEQISSSIKLSANDEAGIKKAYREEYLRAYKRKMQDKARYMAEKHAEEYSKTTIQNALEGAAESVRLRLMEANS